MPRASRLIVEEVPYHIINRGNNRQSIFFDDKDYSFFMKLLKDGKKKYKIKIYGYVLMKNHIHLLMEPLEKDELPGYLRWVCGKYTQYINYIYKRTGTLWEGRYKSAIIGSGEYFLRCLRYIDMNPLRAGIIRQLGEYQWSSCNYYAHGVNDRLIDENPWYLGLGEDQKERQSAYLNFLRETISDEEWKIIRETTQKQGVYSNIEFKREIERRVGRKIEMRKRGRPFTK